MGYVEEKQIVFGTKKKYQSILKIIELQLVWIHCFLQTPIKTIKHAALLFRMQLILHDVFLQNVNIVT